MDFVGDEDATRYALEIALREHAHETLVANALFHSLPSAGVARVFIRELAERGWRLRKDPENEQEGAAAFR